MQTFSSEAIQSYDTYSFGYCNYALRESSDDISTIYNLGFLPYSGAQGVKDVFYMARSVRVKLDGWEPNSENRRILSRFTDIKRTEYQVSSFDYQQDTFLQFCLDYFASRHGSIVMPKERLLHLFTSGLITQVIEYTTSSSLLGYVYEIADSRIAHYIYSFYDLAYVDQSLGLWMMIDSVRAAQENGKDYFYLGTAYGEKGLYKTNFSNLEYWNGHEWVANRELLRTRCKSDGQRTSATLMDEWKAGFIDSHFSHITTNTTHHTELPAPS
jgi:leucyl-tRNA---protein transferase